MPFFKTITILSGLFAGLCVPGTLFWLLGVPGTEGNYANGWNMGLRVVLAYPVVWLILYAPYFVMRNRLSPENRLHWQTVTASLALILLLAAAARLVQAFRTML